MSPDEELRSVSVNLAVQPCVPQTAIKPSNFPDSGKKSLKKKTQWYIQLMSSAIRSEICSARDTIINAARPACSGPDALSFRPRYTASRSLSGCSYLLITETPRRQELTPQPGPRWPAARAPTRPQSFTAGLRVEEEGEGGVTRRGVLNQRGGRLFLLEDGRKRRCVQAHPLCLCVVRVCVCARCSLMQYCLIKGGKKTKHWKVKTGAAFPGALFALGMLWL